MATEICLTISDDGTMTVSQSAEATEQTDPTAEPTGQPVKDIKQALMLIEEMASTATMAQPEAMTEDAAMNESFQQRM